VVVLRLRHSETESVAAELVPVSAEVVTEQVVVLDSLAWYHCVRYQEYSENYPGFVSVQARKFVEQYL
jgi:hypothetical protein